MFLGGPRAAGGDAPGFNLGSYATTQCLVPQGVSEAQLATGAADKPVYVPILPGERRGETSVE